MAIAKAPMDIEQLSPAEVKAINLKLTYELLDKIYSVLKRACLITMLTCFIPAWALYHQNVDTTLLFGWYAIMLVISTSCVLFSIYFQKQQHTPETVDFWVLAIRICVFWSTLAWGSLGIFLVPSTAAGQNFVLFFVIIVASSIALGTSTDYVSSIIGITCALLPYIGWQIHQGVINPTSLHLQTGVTLIAYMFTLLIISFVGYRLVKKSAELSFINVTLKEKLANANTVLAQANEILDQKVKERTEDLEKAVKEVTYLATHDNLTRLSNHRELLDNLNSYIERSAKNKQTFAVACFSIKDLGVIIDCYGYTIANKIILEISTRLKSKIEELNSTSNSHYNLAISRRDDFFILIDPLNSTEFSEKVNCLFSILKEPISIRERDFKLDAYIGICFYPEHGQAADELLANSEAAISSARQNVYAHNKVSLYRNELGEKFRYRLQLEDNLRDAIQNKEFFLEYQPIVNAMENKVHGMEALVRWAHPRLGLLSPNIFISLAEQNGLIIPLGEWILRQACEDTKNLHKQGLTDIKVSVNLSAVQLKSTNILQIILQILKETELDPKYLDLELTETTAFASNEEIVDIFKELKKIGVSLSIDDFGTGHSNLDQLKKFSIDKIKIDGSFVRDLITNKDNQVIINHCVNLGKSLNISVLAECVETKEQLNYLKANGCPLIQGYYFSKPLGVHKLLDYLITHKNGIKEASS